MAKAKAKSKSNDEPPPPVVEPAAEYSVVARRYRPQQFSDLIGQEHVAQALTNAITSGRIAHAYLFTGARGTGKTSTARILAKALNCEKGPTPTPCDQCDICKRIAEGDDVDAVEIDGASNNKVDEARELRSTVNFRPVRARFKIYIIDEVHMVTTAAFNALLKTLEEPPAHVKFIFATTEAQKIPITILSRCQRFDFNHINATKIFQTLRHIVTKEGLKAEDEALRIIAKRAGGSMRDAQTYLDQLLSVTDGPLTAAGIHAILGTAEDDCVIDLATAILARDPGKALSLAASAAERGLQVGELLLQLAEYWRSLMLVSVGGPALIESVVSPTLQESIAKHVTGRSLDTILAGLDVLTTALTRMRGTSHHQVLLEMTVVRMSRLDDLVPIAQLAQTVAAGAPLPAAAARPAPASADASKKNDRPVTATDRPAAGSSLAEFWPHVLSDLGPILAQTLRGIGLPTTQGPNSLALRIPAVYSHIDDATAETVAQSLRKVTGQDWLVRIERTGTAAVEANGSEPIRPAATAAGRQKAILERPLFKRIQEKLGGQLMKLDDGFQAVAEKPVPVPERPLDDGDDPTAAPPADTDEEI